MKSAAELTENDATLRVSERLENVNTVNWSKAICAILHFLRLFRHVLRVPRMLDQPMNYLQRALRCQRHLASVTSNQTFNEKGPMSMRRDRIVQETGLQGILPWVVSTSRKLDELQYI